MVEAAVQLKVASAGETRQGRSGGGGNSERQTAMGRNKRGHEHEAPKNQERSSSGVFCGGLNGPIDKSNKGAQQWGEGTSRVH